MGYGTALYRHKVTVEPFTGSTAVGESFGTGVEVKCRFRNHRKVLRSSDGDEVVADASFICRADEPVSEKDKVTRGSTEYRVVEIKPAEGPHSATNHLMVWLGAD